MVLLMTSVANKYYNTLNEFGIDTALHLGTAWYPDAWAFCRDAGKKYNVSPERVAAMVAVTSPRARWSKNTAAVAMILDDMHLPEFKRQDNYGILSVNARKAMLIANDRYYSRHVTGPKVSNFYLNILGYHEPITVDSIMSKAAGYSSDVNNRIRSEVEQGIRTLSEVIGISPRDTQAAVWCAYRGSGD